jgi:predicted amidophosphoribosyltransferase
MSTQDPRKVERDKWRLQYEEEMIRRIESGEFVEHCPICQHDMHQCPGCGEPMNHKVQICAECKDDEQ